VTDDGAGGRMFAGSGAALGDYDNDGDLDFFLPVGSISLPARDMLLRNDRGIFHNASTEAALVDSVPTENAIWDTGFLRHQARQATRTCATSSGRTKEMARLRT